MCQFKSGIAVKTDSGVTVLTSPFTDSHEHLVCLYKLKDNGQTNSRNWVRVEYSRKPAGDIFDLDDYQLTLDDNCEPLWWEDRKAEVARQMRRVVERAILTAGADLRVGEELLVPAGVVLARTLFCRVVAVAGTVREVGRGGTVWEVHTGGTVQRVHAGGTVWEVHAGGTVREVGDGGTVQRVRAGGTVQKDDNS